MPHTPGQWETQIRPLGDPYNDVVDIATPEGTRVACVFGWPDAEEGGPQREEMLADARLIAAAPELLKACEAFTRWFDGWCPNSRCCADSGLPIHEQALAAIKKANGGCP
jgi:hypothetical protein